MYFNYIQIVKKRCTPEIYYSIFKAVNTKQNECKLVLSRDNPIMKLCGPCVLQFIKETLHWNQKGCDFLNHNFLILRLSYSLQHNLIALLHFNNISFMTKYFKMF